MGKSEKSKGEKKRAKAQRKGQKRKEKGVKRKGQTRAPQGAMLRMASWGEDENWGGRDRKLSRGFRT
jgi:hypothetical protein